MVGLAIWFTAQTIDGRSSSRAPPLPASPVIAPQGEQSGRSTAKVKAAPFEQVSLGDRGGAVKAIQTALAVLGYDGVTPDGAYQNGTAGAVSQFQQESGLRADGSVGPETMNALTASLDRRAQHAAATVRTALDGAQHAGRLSKNQARAAQETLDRSVATLPEFPLGARATVIGTLGDVAANSSVFDQPRVRVLMGALDTSVRYLNSHPVPGLGSTINDADGVSYRLFAGHGFQFHPLASFGALNALATKGRSGDADRLAHALAERGVPSGGGMVWEYYFPFGGPGRWTSGFAQAVAANALERASLLLHDPPLAAEAAAAFRPITKQYLHPLNGGQWIIEYSSSSMLVLNAQLESLLQISEYAKASSNHAAGDAANAMLTATRATLPALDLGCWSLYSVGGNRASTHYHAYHIELLRRLAATTGDSSFGDLAARWSRGLHGIC